MPDLFPDVTTFVLCILIVAGAQLIYASVGFGAGMFAIALLAMVLPDLASAVATLLVLCFLTEVWVLLHTWRKAKVRLLLGLLPTTIVGLWLGTQLLLLGNMDGLKRILGIVVTTAGAWFLYEEWRRRQQPSVPEPIIASNPKEPQKDSGRAWLSLPVGLLAGVLGGLFGTGGPPVILLLKGYRLEKGAFRATLIWYFFVMGLFRWAGYLQAGVLTKRELTAAIWLLPATILGTILGIVVHRRISEHFFAVVVSVLLMILGILLLIGGSK